MQAVNADCVKVEDADTVKVKTEDAVTLPDGSDVNVLWVRFPDLDAHESYTEMGKQETSWAQDWFEQAESAWGEDMYELEVYAPGDSWQFGEYDRLLAKVARRSDGDGFETSMLTEFGTAVAWYD